MSSAKQNRSIARLIVGAMSIDGMLDKKESELVAKTLLEIGMGELVADVGSVIDESEHDAVNLFRECSALRDSLGSDADEMAPLIFHVISEVVAHDRFISEREAAYLSAMSRRLEIPLETAQQTFKQVLAENRGRLEKSGKAIDENIHPHLKELLSFQGSEDLVGEVSDDSLDELIHKAAVELSGGEAVSTDDFSRAMTVLGLSTNASISDAEEVWLETIDNLNLPKMATLGETFVSAAIQRITRVNEAYKAVLHFHDKARSVVSEPVVSAQE